MKIKIKTVIDVNSDCYGDVKKYPTTTGPDGTKSTTTVSSHVVGVVILAHCRSARVVSASANKAPCSETEDKMKMTIQIRQNEYINFPTLYEP